MTRERLVDPRPQPADIDLDDVGVAIEFVLPNSVEDLILAEDLTGASDGNSRTSN
jgi:hypothetical protein